MYIIIILFVYLTSDKPLMPYNKTCYNTKMQMNKWINESYVYIWGGRATGRVGSDILTAIAGRVNVSPSRVGSKKSDP